MLEGRENGMYSKNIRYIPPDIIPLQMWHKSYKQMDEIIISQHDIVWSLYWPRSYRSAHGFLEG